MTKHLTSSLHAVQIVSIRFFFFAIFALIFAFRRGLLTKSLKSKNYLLQIFRGLLIVTEITVFAYAIGHLGLAEIHTLFACFPLIITALSQPLLGEQVGWRRWLAVVVGFIGTLLILKPGFGLLDPFALLALSAAAMFALYNIMTRKVSKTDSFETSLVYFGVVGFLGSLLVVPYYWQAPVGEQYFWLLLISITGIIGHLLLIKALELDTSSGAAALQLFCIGVGHCNGLPSPWRNTGYALFHWGNSGRMQWHFYCQKGISDLSKKTIYIVFSFQKRI